MNYDVIVIGGGAAGLFCAIEAGKRGRRVLVIEHNAQVGRKIVISGGGRCNFTNVHTSAENFVSQNPHFAKSALSRYTPQDFVELVKSHRIEFYEKKLGQLFCRERSNSIVEMLLTECRRTRIRIETNCAVTSVEKNEKFRIGTTSGNYECESLVIATGGLSFPKIGATNFGYMIARQFGLKIVQTRPSLVALVAEGRERFPAAAGVSVDAVVASDAHSFRENILFTHRGLSGPAIIQASNYWRHDVPLSIDVLPGTDAPSLLITNSTSKKKVGNFLTDYLPERVIELVIEKNFVDKPMNQIGNVQLGKIGAKLNAWRLKFIDTEGWHKAEVTLGGVSTGELSSKTMESKKVLGLYFIGEVVDVTGWLGGYNFQWAWSSAFAAGQAV
jgi:predicted Rossmann fold flavoprotein